MSWWNSNKPVLVTSAIILLVAVGVFAALKIRGPVFCTLVGCSGGLTIEVTNLPISTPYRISISFPSGETRTLACDPDESSQVYLFEQSCLQTGAYFQLPTDVKPPKQITVTVEVNGKIVTQVFTPTYEKFQPNGAKCEPTCYVAALSLDFSR